jgi:uncharacterized protein YaaR (DUF327 family)
MAKRRRSKRRSNPEYSDAVFDIVNDFINVLDEASNEGYKTAKKINIKAGDVRVGRIIEGVAEKLRDISESLEDELND